MREHRRMSLRDAVFMLDDEPTRESLIGSFCALLELCKLGIVRVVQGGAAAEIDIELVAAHSDDMDAVISSEVFDDEKPPESADASPEATPEAVPAAESKDGQ
jgi:chromatin segregation and condensation protein Rec8/ScpA/Scc1 (kleisin family)